MSNRTSAFAASSTRRGCSAYQIYQESSNYSTVVLRESMELEKNAMQRTLSQFGNPHRWAPHIGDTTSGVFWCFVCIILK